jgi:hypothetical protein
MSEPSNEPLLPKSPEDTTDQLGVFLLGMLAGAILTALGMLLLFNYA